MNPSSLPLPTSFKQTPAPKRLRRFASMMYEGVLLFAVVFLSDYLFDTLTQSKHGLVLRTARQAWLFGAIGIYFLLCWARSGQTLPMKAWHIRLIGLDGRPARLIRLAQRFLLMWVLPLFATSLVWLLAKITGWPSMLTLIVATPFVVFIPTWFTPQQQFLHDLLANTRLTDVSPSKNP